MTSSYYYECFVPFHLADPAGILFFGNAFTLAHQAFEHFVMHQLTCPWNLWFQNPEWIVPIRHAEAEYVQSIYAGQECHIEITISSISTSSFTLTSSIQQNGLCCSLRTVHVFCQRATKQKMAIPLEIAETLRACRQLTNSSDSKLFSP